MNYLEIILGCSAALFSVGAIAVAVRGRRWNAMPIPQFKRDYKRIVGMADIVQPLLLAVATYIVASIGLEASGLLKVVALLATSVFLSIFVVSFIVLVPLQRRIITTSEDQAEAITTMRTIWIKGHDGRALLGVIGFVLAVVTLIV